MKRLTRKQQNILKRLRKISLPKGELREFYLCDEKGCGQIQSHDFIPYGLGRGRWYNVCHCNAVDSNWIFRAIKL